MALKVVNSGELKLLEWAVKSTTTPEDWTLKLYSNDYTPQDSDTDGTNFTEATFTGYSAETLSRGSWGSPTTNGSGKAEITYGSELSWDAESSQTIYGYFVIATSGTLIYAERFASARALDSGLSLAFTPKLTLSTES